MPNRNRHPRLLLVAAILVTVAAAGACSRVVGPRVWTASAELVAGGTYTVSVRDDSGRIDSVEIDPAGVTAAEPVSNPVGQPNVLLVSWVGGACDRQTDIGISGAAAGLALTIRTTVAPGDCDAIGVDHLLRITASQPLPAAAVTVRTEPSTAG